MFGVGIPELVVAAVVLLLVVVGSMRLLSRGARRAGDPGAVVATRLAGLVVGSVAGLLVLGSGSFGRGLLPAPAVFGLVVLVAVVLGEVVVRPRHDDGPRTASARPRRVRDYLPRAFATVVAGQALALVVLMASTTLSASRDDYSGSMRALACSAPGFASQRTPYPGSFYTLPLALVLLLVALVATVAAKRVVVRPRGTGDDDLRRERSLDVITAAVGVAVSAPYVGVAVTAGMALQGLGTSVPVCAAGWTAPLGVALLVTAALAAVLLLTCAVMLISGGGTTSPSGDRGHDLVRR